MAIYHYSAQVVSRASGGSSVAKAAYRTGQNLTNERTAEVHDYTKKRGVVDHAIFVPPNSPEWAKQTASLWNGVEVAETRKDAQLCREINVTIPAELNKGQAIALAKHYGQWLSATHGTAVEIAVHRDDAKDRLGNKKPDAQRGYHFHVMESLRVLGPDGFGEKAVSQKVFKGAKAPAEANRRLEEERAMWEQVANKALALAGHSARIDRRTLKEQGIDRQPDPTLGVAVTALNRKGKPSHVMARIERQKALARDDKAINRLQDQAEQLGKAIDNQEQRNEQRNSRHRQYAARTPATTRDNLPRMHERRHLRDAERAHHLLPGNALDRVGEREAQGRADRVQRERAADRLTLTPEQLASLNKVLEDGIRRARDEAARKATADREQQQDRPRRRQEWQAKHLRSPGIALAAGTPPKPGLPNRWTYSDGPGKGKVFAVDYGDRIKPAGKLDQISDHKIAALLEAVKTKNWPALTITGPQDFRMRVAEAAQARGMPLGDLDLVQALRAKAEQQRKAEAEQKRIQAQMFQSTPGKAERTRADDVTPNRTPQPAPSPSPSKPLTPPPQAAQATPQAPQGPTLAELRTALAEIDRQATEIRAEPVLRPLAMLTSAEAQYLAAKEANKAAGQKLHPENEHEYAHQYGNGLALHVAKQQKAEHAKTQRPLMIGRAAWDAEAKRLNDQVAELTGAIAGDSFKLMRRGKQIHAERIQESAKRDEQIKQQVESKAQRLAALAQKREGIEAQVKHPRFAEQIKQENERQRERERERQKSRSHGHSTPGKGRGGGGMGL